MDIGAPNYAGSASALMNAAGAIAGILSPVAFGWILDRTGSWTTPFALSGGLLLFAIVMTRWIRPGRPIQAVTASADWRSQGSRQTPSTRRLRPPVVLGLPRCRRARLLAPSGPRS
jgi:MFS family permease